MYNFYTIFYEFLIENIVSFDQRKLIELKQIFDANEMAFSNFKYMNNFDLLNDLIEKYVLLQTILNSKILNLLDS